VEQLAHEPDGVTGFTDPGGKSQQPPILHSHIAYFLIPLPNALALPDKHMVLCAAETPGQRYRNNEAEGLALPPQLHLATSLLFHHAESDSPTAGEADQLFRFAREVFRAPDGEPITETTRLTTEASTPPTPRTFVEMAVPFDPNDLEDGGVSDAFDNGLRYVREVQRAYYLVQRRPVRLATREAMPFTIPFGIRQLFDASGEPLPFRVPLSMFLLHMNLYREVRDEELTPHRLKRLAMGLRQQGHRGFVTDYLELVRETQVALSDDGSYRAAVLFSATSCEVLLDNLLAHMLWEEAKRPEDASSYYDSPTAGITARVKRHFHTRIGGRWSVDTPGPLHDWFTQVAGLRNRVSHGGYEPTLTEAQAAAGVAGALAAHLGDLVADAAGRYPRTALALPGEAGLHRRGKWSRRLERVREKPQEVDWIPTFARWRTAMQRAVDDSPTYLAPSVENAWLLAVLRPGETEKWVVHDREAGMAATVDPPRSDELTAAQREALGRLRARPTADADSNPQSLVVFGVTLKEPPPRDWLLEYRLVPMAGVMVDGTDLDTSVP